MTLLLHSAITAGCPFKLVVRVRTGTGCTQPVEVTTIWLAGLSRADKGQFIPACCDSFVWTGLKNWLIQPHRMNVWKMLLYILLIVKRVKNVTMQNVCPEASTRVQAITVSIICLYPIRSMIALRISTVSLPITVRQILSHTMIHVHTDILAWQRNETKGQKAALIFQFTVYKDDLLWGPC